MSSDQRTIGLYVQPWNKHLFLEISKHLTTCPPIILSNFEKLDKTQVFSDYRKYLFDYNVNSCFTADEINDTILKCRLLRELPYAAAIAHVKSLSFSINNFFSSISIDCLLMEAVDQYYHDIIFKIAKLNNIKVICLVGSMINGYSRITNTEGDYIENRTYISPSEVNSQLQMLCNSSYLPSYVPSSSDNITFRYLRNYCVNFTRFLYYTFLTLLRPYTLDYHVKVNVLGYLRNNLSLPIHFKFITNISSIISSKRLKIYIPLHFYPEATNDYWCESAGLSLYYDQLFSFIQKLNPYFDLCIKEHPAALGFRSYSFYQSLDRFSNTYLISPFCNSRTLIAKCDATLVWNSSVGLEAHLMNKPVIYANKPPYYSYHYKVFSLSKFTDITELKNFISETHSISSSTIDQHVYLEHLLRGCIPVLFRNNGSFNLNNSSHRQEAKNLSSFIHSYLH